MNFETIRERWQRRYINDAQLQRMLQLTVITKEEFDKLWNEKYPPVQEPEGIEPPAETPDTVPTEPENNEDVITDGYQPEIPV